VDHISCVDPIGKWIQTCGFLSPTRQFLGTNVILISAILEI
jgi:hypothetical protein